MFGNISWLKNLIREVHNRMCRYFRIDKILVMMTYNALAASIETLLNWFLKSITERELK